ncbi:Patatin-like phospholipase [Stigmatella aurantiaca]|uniref:Patatin-like phospholipase n=1 Tax=Stigmatella aurantiaca TaxID=41 RepID=A0A1H8CL42_STIAU|nr:patatin-like phospholipase family protein [Stigmatella aurantiaca]SEM95154.1 Patatin-like phospholipase [Stigmatella aurantiaca]
MNRVMVLLVTLSTLACSGRLDKAYVAYTPYAASSPLNSDTIEYGLPRDPLHPGSPGKFALPSSRPDQDAECIVTLSISGGGSNSAAFAWGALEELNERYQGPDGRSVLQEVDYITTASGGGIAALMFIEVLREHRLREGKALTQESAGTYLGSARFRGVLDAQLSTMNQVLASGLLSWFGHASTKVEHSLRSAMVGSGARCQGREAGPLAAVPKKTDEEFSRYSLCPLTDALKFGDVFVDASQQATLPTFLPTMTLFESGNNLPATQVWFKQLGIQEVLLALPNSSLGDVVKVEDLDYVHAVTLSMGFPGIGPVLATAKHGGSTFGVTIADGGQTDNLGLWVAYNATRNELRDTLRRGAVHIVLDSAIEPETPFVEEKMTGWESVTGARVIGNGLPLLRVARLTNEQNLKLRAQDDLKEKADTYRPIFVRAGDVLDTREMRYHCFVNILNWRGGYREDLETDSKECLAKSGRCETCTPRARLGKVLSSLANDQQRSEDLVTLGREAMARAYEDKLKGALDHCLKQEPSTPPTPVAVP